MASVKIILSAARPFIPPTVLTPAVPTLQRVTVELGRFLPDLIATGKAQTNELGLTPSDVQVEYVAVTGSNGLFIELVFDQYLSEEVCGNLGDDLTRFVYAWYSVRHCTIPSARVKVRVI